MPNISSPGPNVKFLADVAGIVNAEADAPRPTTGVNKIILSSHLQNVDFEKTLIKSAAQRRHRHLRRRRRAARQPVRPARPDQRRARRRPPGDGRRVPGAGHGRRRRHGAGRHHAGRVPLRRPPHGRRSTAGRQPVETDTARSGPVRVSAWAGGPFGTPPVRCPSTRTTCRPRTRTSRPTSSTRSTATRRCWRPTSSAPPSVNARRRQPEPDPRQARRNLGDLVADGFRFAANRTAVEDGRPVAEIAFSNGGGIRTSIAGPAANINEKQTFDVLPFDNVIVTVPNVSAAEAQGADGVGRRAPSADRRRHVPADQRVHDGRSSRARRRVRRIGRRSRSPGTARAVDHADDVRRSSTAPSSRPSRSTSRRRTSPPTAVTAIRSPARRTRSRVCRGRRRSTRTRRRCSTSSPRRSPRAASVASSTARSTRRRPGRITILP